MILPNYRPDLSAAAIRRAAETAEQRTASTPVWMTAPPLGSLGRSSTARRAEAQRVALPPKRDNDSNLHLRPPREGSAYGGVIL
jgi:hypothetical protein